MHIGQSKLSHKLEVAIFNLEKREYDAEYT